LLFYYNLLTVLNLYLV